jgi:uncharacterized membrane protein
MASSTASSTSSTGSNNVNHRDPSGYINNPPSTVVKVVGTGRDDINGLLGIVVSYNVERERYLVFMPISQSTMALKVQNLRLASTVEKYRAQFQQLQNDPRVKEKVAHYIKMAEKYVRPFKLQHALGSGFVFLALLVYLFGFTRTFMVLSLTVLLGVISGRDILARQPVMSILKNFPNRANETLSKQIPFLKGRLTNNMALGIVLVLIAFTFQSLFFPAGIGFGGRSSTTRSTQPTTSGPFTSQPRLDREIMQKYYNMGFEDATNVMEHGHSLKPELQRLLEEEAGAAPLLEDDELFLNSTPLQQPPLQRSILSKLANFSTLGSLFYVYRIIKEKGTEQSTGLFSVGQLAANLQHHTEVWQQGVLVFSLYNLFRIFWS